MSEFKNKELTEIHGSHVWEAEYESPENPETTNLAKPTEKSESDLKPENITINASNQEDKTSTPELIENVPSKEKGELANTILTYIETNKKNEGSWEKDFDFAKKLAEQGKFEEALKLALLAREAQIKEGSQKETPVERQI
jgi:hypothetical protein